MTVYGLQQFVDLMNEYVINLYVRTVCMQYHFSHLCSCIKYRFKRICYKSTISEGGTIMVEYV